MKKWALSGATLGVMSMFGLLVSRSSSAFDHQDGPSTVEDPSTDITDVYSFMRPAVLGDGGPTSSNHLVMIMNVNPSDGNARFATNLTYSFTVRPVTTLATLQTGDGFAVTCSFTNSEPQEGTCVANGSVLAVKTNQITGTDDDDLRVFAGRRADPAFADVKGLNDSLAAKSLKFANPGVNTFDKKTVLSIVVDYNLAAGGGVGAPVVAVSGHTVRN